MDIRPKLNKKISIKDFQEFYWLKKELTQFCRLEKLNTTGSKVEISERISNYIRSGEKHSPKKIKPTSKFDWNFEILSTETAITDNYKNTETVRAFFQKEIGAKFKFNTKFMNWMKSNSGKTLADAIQQWHLIFSESKSNSKPKEISAQFEYNRYLRDFLADNPKTDRKVGIKLWKIKKTLRGDNIYQKEDLELRLLASKNEDHRGMM